MTLEALATLIGVPLGLLLVAGIFFFARVIFEWIVERFENLWDAVRGRRTPEIPPAPPSLYREMERADRRLQDKRNLRSAAEEEWLEEFREAEPVFSVARLRELARAGRPDGGGRSYLLTEAQAFPDVPEAVVKRLRGTSYYERKRRGFTLT